MYESTLTFTLDTICPWTYLGKKRLESALANFQASSPNAQKATFKLRFAPYQLYPAMSSTGEPKRSWYTTNKYGNSDAKFEAFAAVMDSYAEPLGFKFNWDGPMASTLEAHRVIQVFQGGEGLSDSADLAKKYGPQTAARIVDAVYRMYFEEGRHPSSEETLLAACQEAGVEEADARRVVVEEKDLELKAVQRMIKLVDMNGVDSVPTIMMEGKRRDLTLVGAKEVAEYEKALETIAKEGS